MTNTLRFMILVMLIGLMGCQENGSSVTPTISTDHAVQEPERQVRRQKTPARLTAKDIEGADVSVLFIGNSHCAPLPGMLNEIFQRQLPGKVGLAHRVSTYGFLADHVKRKSTRDLIQLGSWDFVVLQAQKYSSSGKYTYPTDAAIELARLAQAQGSKVIMYPEWARRDVPDEYARIKAIHNSIAEKTESQVAPIGEAWDRVQEAQPKLNLYAVDGNHASELGSYLNACVFFGMVTGKSPQRPASEADTDEQQQSRHLEQAAWQAVEAFQELDVPENGK